jgi:hypothetical protein
VAPERSLHVVHLLIRSQPEGGPVCFLVYPHATWKPYLILPAKKTVIEQPLAHSLRGSSLEHFLEDVLQVDLKLADDDYVLEQELVPVGVEMVSPSSGLMTHYTIYPVDVWVKPAGHEALRAAVQGEWLTCDEALADSRLSPTAAAVFRLVQKREKELDETYKKDAEAEQKPGAPRRLLRALAERPTMDALALKWLSHNRGGVRHLPKQTLDAILDAGPRAFNLRVADPYLRYQCQGLGFTWSFFTHKDRQDLHVHGIPVVEIYGVLEGRLEVWWKPYHDRGTSAWCRQELAAGDWLEVDSLQCHIVHWLTEGKGVVFKAGPGPLAGVGRLGVEGKMRCQEQGMCLCMKPPQVQRLEGPAAGER